jgi:hypothetical protein
LILGRRVEPVQDLDSEETSSGFSLEIKQILGSFFCLADFYLYANKALSCHAIMMSLVLMLLL